MASRPRFSPDGPRSGEVFLHGVRRNRFLPVVVEQAVNTILSRGPGYEPVPIGQAFDDSAVRGYYIDYRSKTTTPALSDPSKVNIVPVIQLGLGWYERDLAGDATARGELLRVCQLIEDRGQPRGPELRWPTWAPQPKFRLTPPWSSALSQGQAASLFVRAHRATGDDRYAELALRAIRPLLSQEGSDLVTHTGAGPIFQEYPSDPPSHVLNGWISALWGVWDVHLALGEASAGDAAEAAISCLRANLHAYDVGWWTRYSLYPFALADLAKPIYQGFHVAQLTVLHRLTGYDDFGEVARRWARYDRPGNRALALAQKSAFAALDLPRRRRWQR